jgi:hypothetical protein
MRKIREKEAAVRCLKVEPTDLAIKDIAIMTRVSWLLAPLIKQALDTWDPEER